MFRFGSGRSQKTVGLQGQGLGSISITSSRAGSRWRTSSKSWTAPASGTTTRVRRACARGARAPGRPGPGPGHANGRQRYGGLRFPGRAALPGGTARWRGGSAGGTGTPAADQWGWRYAFLVPAGVLLLNGDFVHGELRALDKQCTFLDKVNIVRPGPGKRCFFIHDVFKKKHQLFDRFLA